MPKVYTAVFYRETPDETAMAAYGALAGPALAASGGRVIARGLPLATREHGLAQRALIIEWDSIEAATAIYETEAYRAAVARLGGDAVRDIRILEAAG